MWNLLAIWLLCCKPKHLGERSKVENLQRWLRQGATCLLGQGKKPFALVLRPRWPATEWVGGLWSKIGKNVENGLPQKIGKK